MLYLDNSATTPVHPEVIRVVEDVLRNHYGNPSSLHQKGLEGEKLLETSRQIIAQSLEVSSDEVIFTSGGTEGDNLAIKGIAFGYQARGRHIITSQIEHPAVRESCRFLEQFGFTVTYLPVDNQGLVDPQELEANIKEDTILVSIMHVNNEVGTIQPIQELGTIIKKHPKIFFHVDGVQGYAKVPIKLKEWGVDLFTVSSHKINGPKGVGALYIRKGINLLPQISGGGQERGLRSGTENIPSIVGFAKACQIAREMFEENGEKLSELRRYCIMMLKDRIPGVIINGSEDANASPYILNVSIPGLRGEVIVHGLEKEKIFVSTGSACSSKKDMVSPVLEAMGIKREIMLGSIRISFSYQTRHEDIILLGEKLAQVVKELTRKASL